MSRVKISKPHATGSYRVNIWGPDRRMPVAPQITVSLVIGHDEHKIRQLSGMPSTAGCNCRQTQQQKESRFHDVLSIHLFPTA